MSGNSKELLRFFLAKSRQFDLRTNLALWLEGYIRLFVSWVPGFEGMLVRNLLYRLICKRIQGFCYIMPGVYFTHAHRLELGNRVGINSGCNLACRGGLRIGNDSQLGPNVVIVTSGHDFFDPARPIIEQGHTDGPVTLGSDVWIGANATVLPGVTIADGTIVGAGAVVTRDTEPYSIVAGVPARKIGNRGAGTATAADAQDV